MHRAEKLPGAVRSGSGVFEGQGVTKDYAEAAKWYLKEPVAGNAAAQGDLGVMYLTGMGVKQDATEAQN